MKPVSLKLETQKSNEVLNPYKLIKDMKTNLVMPVARKCQSCQGSGLKNLDYIFVTEELADASKKEKALSQFLNKEGIFRINLSITMKEFSFQ